MNASPKMGAGGSDGSNQFLTFTLDCEEYGIEILKVQEIKGFSKITPIPNAPPFVKGVMNLRGAVVPIVDLRSRFAMAARDYDQFTVIIVVNLGDKIVGLVVDTVSDVMTIPEANVAETPELAGGVDASCITGMGKVDEKLVMLLDIARLVGGEPLRDLDFTAA
jgi:purine-binding chemotaxis protein CheW